MKTSCIMPFYNEGERIFTALEQVLKVKNLDELILVDDGSTDKTYLNIQNKFRSINLVRYSKNLGKSGAIKVGLNAATYENILMLDADLINLSKNKIEEMIANFEDSETDMIILRYDEPWYIKIFGTDLSLSGVKILSKQDLEEVFKKYNPAGYQLEIAINNFMIEKKKKVFYMDCIDLNHVSKIKKNGFFNGVIKEIKMITSLITYLGPIRFFYQLYFFGRKKFDS